MPNLPDWIEKDKPTVQIVANHGSGFSAYYQMQQEDEYRTRLTTYAQALTTKNEELERHVNIMIDFATKEEARTLTKIQALAEDNERLKAALNSIAQAESQSCQRCEGNGRMWADGKAHYPSDTRETVACTYCGGDGRLAVDLEEVQGIAKDALLTPPEGAERGDK